MRKLVILLLCLVLLGSVCVYAAEGQTIANVNDAATLPAEADPVRITTATLYADGVTGEEVYVVACQGMDFTSLDPNNARSVTNAVKIGLSDPDNAYVKTVCDAIYEVVPHGSKLVFIGHSMGGMVVQQVIAQKELKQDYEILYTLSLGSPYIITAAPREGVLRRMVDKADIVPYLSIAGLANPLMGNVSLERSNIFPLVHFYGYKQGACWRSYDCMGVKGGSAYMTLHEIVYG